MNPCPCGNYPDPEKCSCTPGQIQRYLDTVSQPFLDRMDLCVEVPRISMASGQVNFLLLQRLPQHFQHRFLKFRQLVQKLDTAVGKTDFSRQGRIPAAHKRRLCRCMMNISKRSSVISG